MHAGAKRMKNLRNYYLDSRYAYPSCISSQNVPCSKEKQIVCQCKNNNREQFFKYCDKKGILKEKVNNLGLGNIGRKHS